MFDLFKNKEKDYSKKSGYYFAGQKKRFSKSKKHIQELQKKRKKKSLFQKNNKIEDKLGVATSKFDLKEKQENNNSKKTSSKYRSPNGKKIETKIFAPEPKNSEDKKEVTLAKEIKDYQKKPEKVFLKSKKNSEISDTPDRLENVSLWQKIIRGINYWAYKFRIFEKLNRFIFTVIIATSLLVFVYLAFFDSYFLIKNYTFSFGPNSYLSETELNKLTQSFSQNPLLGVIPNNQFWFVSERNLTAVAQETIPEIVKVDITRRHWPNGIELKVTTEPILATLGIIENGQQKYWRITQSGRVLTEDVARLREDLVQVFLPITLTTGLRNASFADYPLEDNSDLVNRLWFTIWLREVLEVQISNIYLPSLVDTEVVVVTTNQTRLYFDSDIKQISRETLRNRINVIQSSKIADDLATGGIEYIDYRIPAKKVFVCYVNTTCSGVL